ncbi:MAG: class I SAM-dependent methyltransferase [Geobacteraceae bacterium]
MSNLIDMDQKPDGYYSLSREKILHYIPDNAIRILDIGCGEGNFGGLLKTRREVEVWGLELNDAAALKAAEQLDKVICGDIETDYETLPDNYFDCIVFNDCLEHLLNPWRILRQLRAKVAAGGCVVASIPNVRYYRNVKRLLFYKDWKYTDEGILDKTHLRFFTKKSMKRMFSEAGFQLVRIEGIPGRFRFHVWLLNLLLLGSMDDMQYLQFACVARKDGGEPRL